MVSTFFRYYTPRPNFQFSLIGGLYECKLTLPPNSVFQTLVGPVSKSSHLSKQLVCLEACKKLHQMGALDDHLLPYVDNSENNPNPTSKESALAAGRFICMYPYMYICDEIWVSCMLIMRMWIYLLMFCKQS